MIKLNRNARISTLMAAAVLSLVLACGQQDTQVKDMAQKAEQAQGVQQQVQTAGQQQQQQLAAAGAKDVKPNPETMQLTADQKALLEARLKAEKGTGTGDLLQAILDKDKEIGELNQKLGGLRALLPKPVMAKEGDNHYAMAMAFLRKRGVNEEKAKDLIAKTNILEKLEPGWEVYHFYVNGKYGTSVSQGHAPISPTEFIQQAKVKTEGERDEAIKKGQDLAKQLDSLNIEKQRVEADIVALRQEKTGLLDQVASLNTLSEKQKAKLNSMHYLVGQQAKLEQDGVVVIPFFSKNRMGPNAKSLRFDKDLMLDGPSEPVVLIKAADMGVAKIGKVSVVPGSLIKDQHYTISYAADHSTATIKILDPDRVRDDRVAFAISE